MTTDTLIQNTETLKTSVWNRAVLLLTDSPKAWTLIATEPGGFRELFVPYGLALAAVVAVSGFLKAILLTTILMPGMGAQAGPMISAVSTAGLHFIVACAMPLIVSRIMVLVAPRFKAKADWLLCCRVLVYGSTPVALASVAGIVPVIGNLASIAGFFWTLYLVYQALDLVLGAENDNHLLFMGSIALSYAACAIFWAGSPSAWIAGCSTNYIECLSKRAR